MSYAVEVADVVVDFNSLRYSKRYTYIIGLDRTVRTNEFLEMGTKLISNY